MVDFSGDKNIEKSLKSWKTVLVGLDDGLRLRCKEVTAGLVFLFTLGTFLVWLYEPPIISSLSFLGIILVIGEQFVPIIMNAIVGDSGEKIWNADKTIKYKKLCKELDYYCDKLEDLGKWLSHQKDDNPLLYVTVVSSVLAVIGYISYRVNTIWAGYFFTLALFGFRAFWFEHQHKGFLERMVSKKD